MQNEGPAAQVLAPRPGVTEEAVRRSELGMPAAGVIDGVAFEWLLVVLPWPRLEVCHRQA